jgi:Fe-S oxidoreductase/nitrate reductase gamma subunit
MLPLSNKIAFLVFAFIMLGFGTLGFYRAYLRIRRGRPDADLRTDHWPSRLWYALKTTLTQQRTFRKRGIVSFFHSFIFYGFTFYLLVNLVDAVEGYVQVHPPRNVVTDLYDLFADVLSFLVLVGVVALVARRFVLPARRDFRFNERTLLHKDVERRYISHDSLIVSAFILFHVGSRAIGAGAKIAGAEGDPYEPFAALLSHLFSASNARAWQVFGYWGALGSVLAFLAYFPYTKHIHIFAAPLKYFFARTPNSGVLPLAEINLEAEEQNLGAEKLEDLSWPRLLDAYACIQCNRCQDVCPATATGKSLSPAALEINKRMELNDLAHHRGANSFEQGSPSPHPLLSFALTPEAAWACTTCGACMEVCPVQDEQMLDIIDIRRNQVMIKGEFPTQLQTAFRGMERAKNPWGISHDKRMAWTEGLSVKTTDENPTPDVLYWVGCAASYDPQAQKTARAVVQLLDHAGVDFAVLGKKECCTGDSARRGGNELLYRELADQNVSTLNEVKPKLILASCPHCMNSLGNEYKQIGGDYKVMHHTEYLESLVASGKLQPERSSQTITYHDPCYLGRHSGVYDAPRNLLRVLGSEMLELERNRSDSFCCGAGGAQFWKEEEPGTERVSENRFKEVQRVLDGAIGEKTLAVGCPFCKSMLGSTPSKDDGAAIAIKDVAELLLEGVLKKKGIVATTAAPQAILQVVAAPAVAPPVMAPPPASAPLPEPPPSIAPPPERKKWRPKPAAAEASASDAHSTAPAPERKKWQPKPSTAAPPVNENRSKPEPTGAPPEPPPVECKKWQPKSKS